MTLRFVDPRGVPARPTDPYLLSADLTAAGCTVGLLANGFPDSVTFLDELELVLNEQLPTVRTLRYAKPNASDIADDQLLAGITRECRAVVTAYGH
jgi:hypothetical protein